MRGGLHKTAPNSVIRSPTVNFKPRCTAYRTSKIVHKNELFEHISECFRKNRNAGGTEARTPDPHPSFVTLLENAETEDGAALPHQQTPGASQQTVIIALASMLSDAAMPFKRITNLRGLSVRFRITAARLPSGF